MCLWFLVSHDQRDCICVSNRPFMPMHLGGRSQLCRHREGWGNGMKSQDRKTGSPWRKTSSLIRVDWALKNIQSIPWSSSLQWYQIHLYRVFLDTSKNKLHVTSPQGPPSGQPDHMKPHPGLSPIHTCLNLRALTGPIIHVCSFSEVDDRQKAKFDPPPVFVDKGFLEPRHTHSFIFLVCATKAK